MEDDFLITRDGKHWMVAALSDRAREMAENDPRFHEAEAKVEAERVTALYSELNGLGFFVATPSGLPPQSGTPALLLVGLLLIVILIPLLLADLF